MGTISEKLAYLNGTKDAIKTAIIGKGVSVGSDTPFRQFAEKITSIPSGVQVHTLDGMQFSAGVVASNVSEGGFVAIDGGTTYYTERAICFFFSSSGSGALHRQDSHIDIYRSGNDVILSLSGGLEKATVYAIYW